MRSYKGRETKEWKLRIKYSTWFGLLKPMRGKSTSTRNWIMPELQKSKIFAGLAFMVSLVYFLLLLQRHWFCRQHLLFSFSEVNNWQRKRHSPPSSFLTFCKFLSKVCLKASQDWHKSGFQSKEWAISSMLKKWINPTFLRQQHRKMLSKSKMELFTGILNRRSSRKKKCRKILKDRKQMLIQNKKSSQI